MASHVKDAFQALRKHVRSAISQLLDSVPNQSNLIYDEIHALSTELDSMWACHLAESPVVSPAAKTPVDRLSPSHPITQPMHAASTTSDQEGRNTSPTITASNGLKKQKSVHSSDTPARYYNTLCDSMSETDTSRAETFHGQDSLQIREIHRLPVDIPPLERRNLGTRNQSPLESSLEESSSVQETHPSEVFAQNQEQFSSRAANTPPPNLLLHNEDLTVSITHDIQDGVIRLLPTAEQWWDFPKLLQHARDLGLEKVGIGKVLLPEDAPGRTLLTHSNAVKQQGHRFVSHSQGNGPFQIEREEVDVLLQLAPSVSDSSMTKSSSAGELVQRFEQLLERSNGLEAVTYCTDIDIRTEALRAKIGLPNECPISPLDGDRLCDTKIRVPGIHWPYAYQSGDAFGAPFTMHVEDYWLISINYLYAGDKIWVTVAPEHLHLLEQKLKATNGSIYPYSCEQFLRHSATYIPRKTLDEWRVSYALVHQKSHEVVITFPRAYHEGFSAGYTFAVAVNYADARIEQGPTRLQQINPDEDMEAEVSDAEPCMPKYGRSRNS